MLQVHTITSARGSRKRKKRIGRGNASGHGTTATRGTKGQRSRTGGRGGLKRVGFKLILQRIPKLRGFRSLAQKPVTITLAQLDKAYTSGATVNLVTLHEKGLVGKQDTAARIVRTGVLTKKLLIENVGASASARTEVEKAGGTIK